MPTTEGHSKARFKKVILFLILWFEITENESKYQSQWLLLRVLYRCKLVGEIKMPTLQQTLSDIIIYFKFPCVKVQRDGNVRYCEQIHSVIMDLIIGRGFHQFIFHVFIKHWINCDIFINVWLPFLSRVNRFVQNVKLINYACKYFFHNLKMLSFVISPTFYI